MEIKNRKLFPESTSFNQTTDCSGFCDPACPYNCYPYSDDYLLPPPPPPPSPLSLMSQEHHISPYVIILVALLASFFLIVCYYVIVAKSCSGWCGSRSNRQQRTQADNADEEFLGENQVDHPIWFITTIGLQQSIINSITICRYKKGEGLIEGTECSVCLSEFQQDETLRLLPKCNHAFHISCIDTWLRSHTNCPLCRAQIINDAVRIPLISVNHNPDNLTPHVSNQRENSESATGLSNIQESNENRAGTEDQGSEILQVGDERTMKDDGNSNEKDHFQKLHDCLDKHQIVRNDIPKSMRRSSSMDSLTATTISIGDISDHSPLESVGSSVNQMENNGEADSTSVTLKRDGGCSSMFKTTGSSSVAQCLHKGPVSMKRSFSCGGRFFSSRQQNRSLNSILPL